MPESRFPPARRRVLLVTQAFPPSASVGALRPAKFCKYLPCFGWTPRVLTTRAEYYPDTDPQLEPDLLATCDVVRTGMSELPRFAQAPLDAVRTLVHRRLRPDWVAQSASQPRGPGDSFWWARFAFPDPGTPWIPEALAAGRAAVQDCDAVYSTYPCGANHYIALKLSREAGLPWIADFRDPWSFGMHRTALASWKRWMNGRVERATVASCRFVVSTTDAITERFRQVYPDLSPSKFVTIPNGFDPDDFPPDRESARGGRASNPEIFEVAYFGRLYAGRDTHGLLQALRTLLDTGRVDAARFRLVLYGPPPLRVEEEAGRYSLQGLVRAGGFVGYRRALRLMCRSSVLVLIGSPRTDDLCVATKLYEYWYARRPILALVPPGPIRRFVKDHHLGESVCATDVDAIARHLAGWYEAFKEGRLSASQSEPPARYNRKYQAGQLADLLNAATNVPGG